MGGRVYTLKPSLDYNYSTKRDKNTEEISLKERFLEWLGNFLLILLAVLFLIITIAIAYKALVFFKIKFEKRTLNAEKVQLERELSRLTSREVVSEKAKALGLREPQEHDIIRLR